MTEVQSAPTSVSQVITPAAVKEQLEQHANGQDNSDLTDEEKQLIRGDWDLARKDLQTVATKLYLVFFMQNPTYPEMFRWAKGIDIPSLTIDTPFDTLPKRMHFHALAAAKQISVIVDNLENPDGLQALFTTIGEQHAGRNVSPGHWESFNKSLLYLLRVLLTPAGYDDKHEAAWKKALQVITDASLKTTTTAEAASKNKVATDGVVVTNGKA